MAKANWHNTHTYICILNHLAVHLGLAQHYKPTVLQLKIIKIKLKRMLHLTNEEFTFFLRTHGTIAYLLDYNARFINFTELI